MCQPESLLCIKYVSIIIYVVKFNIWFVALLFFEVWGRTTVALATPKLFIISEKDKAMLYIKFLKILASTVDCLDHCVHLPNTQVGQSQDETRLAIQL